MEDTIPFHQPQRTLFARKGTVSLLKIHIFPTGHQGFAEPGSHQGKELELTNRLITPNQIDNQSFLNLLRSVGGWLNESTL